MSHRKRGDYVVMEGGRVQHRAREVDKRFPWTPNFSGMTVCGREFSETSGDELADVKSLYLPDCKSCLKKLPEDLKD